MKTFKITYKETDSAVNMPDIVQMENNKPIFIPIHAWETAIKLSEDVETQFKMIIEYDTIIFSIELVGK